MAPFLKVAAMAVFPFILVKDKKMINDEVLLRHERIHLRQEAELLIVPFYFLYLINYLINRLKYKTHNQAYLNICFEREAYANELNTEYLKKRKFWQWMRYVN